MIQLAQIIEEPDFWKLVLFPEADFVEIIDEPSKGYKAHLGYHAPSDRHVVMYVWYNKKQYPIGEVLKKIEEMKSCPRCDTLDKKRLEDITIQTHDTVQPVAQPVRHTERYREVEHIPSPQQLQPVPASKPIVPRGNVKDMFANAMFDAFLTPAGKFMVGNVFGDDQLVESAMPKNQNELAQLWSDTTSGKLLRSPEDAKKFMSVLRSDSEEDDTSANKKKAKKATQGIVIY